MDDNYLSSQYFLKEINSIWRSVLHLGRQTELPANTVLPKENRQYFSFLDKGRIRLETFNMHGGIRFSKFFDSGCIIGETPVFQNSDIIVCSLVTLEPCTIFHFPAKLLKDSDFIKEHPELVINLLESLTFKLATSYEIMADSNEPKPKQAICRFLDTLAQKNGKEIFAPLIKQEDLAFTLGFHRSTVCKIIQELRKEGILGVFNQKKLEILDRARLQKYAKGD